MSSTRDIIAAEAEKTATVRSISAIVGSTITNAKGHTCLWFGIQNKDAAISLFLQDDNDATVANDNVEIAPGVYKAWPPCDAKYDLREEFIRVGTNDPVFSIEIMWG